MIKYEINKSKLIFDINKLREKITQKLYESALDKEGVNEDDELSRLAIELLLSLRATLASFNYNNLLENQKIVEKTLNIGSDRFHPVPKIYWNSLREFRLNYWNKLGDAQKKMIEFRTNNHLVEHVLTNNDKISYYYYTLERNQDEVLRL